MTDPGERLRSSLADQSASVRHGGLRQPHRDGGAAGDPRPARRRPGALPAAGADPHHHDRQPEGRRRQDDVHGEPRRRAGPLRPADAGHRPGPPGEREHRPRRGPHRRDAVDLRRPRRRQHPHRGRAPDDGQPAPALRPGDDRPGRRGDRAGLGRRPRAPAAPRHRGLHRRAPRGEAPALRAHRLPAVPGAAHAERAGRRRRGAHPDPVRVLRARGAGPAAQQHRPGPRSTSTRGSPSARSC